LVQNFTPGFGIFHPGIKLNPWGLSTDLRLLGLPSEAASQMFSDPSARIIITDLGGGRQRHQVTYGCSVEQLIKMRRSQRLLFVFESKFYVVSVIGDFQ
jgi:hypothetical protein